MWENNDLVRAYARLCLHWSLGSCFVCFSLAETALERDYFMTAQEALEFGIIDEILENRRPSLASEGGRKTGESA